MDRDANFWTQSPIGIVSVIYLWFSGWWLVRSPLRHLYAFYVAIQILDMLYAGRLYIYIYKVCVCARMCMCVGVGGGVHMHVGVYMHTYSYVYMYVYKRFCSYL